jgi:uncharacterized membrane protein
MCFSAGASFGAGLLISTIGAVSLRQVTAKEQIPFAAIPMIFGIQQFTEGLLWMALTRPEYVALKEVSMYHFLFFAQVVWPVWVPYAIWRIQPAKERNIWLKMFTILGAVVSLYLFYCLLNFKIDASVSAHHIMYHQSYPKSLQYPGAALYLIATIAPPFLSKFRHMRLLGIAVLISYIITMIFYTSYVISVWCFFAAVISASVWYILNRIKSLKDVSV